MTFKGFIAMIAKVISKFPPSWTVVVFAGLTLLVVLAVKRIFF